MCESPTPEDWNTRLECYLPHLPVSKNTKRHITNFLFAVALLQSVPTLILLWSVWKTGETAGLNLMAFAIQLTVSAFWVTYGLIIRSCVVVMASSLLIVATLTLVALVIATRRREEAEAANPV